MDPFRVKENGREITYRLVVAVSKTDYAFLRPNPELLLMWKTSVIPIDERDYSAAQISALDSAKLENATSFKKLQKYIQRLKDFENGRKNQKSEED